MAFELQELLKNRAFNGWKLFWLITVPISFIMVLAMMRVDSWNGETVSSMIQLSVRWAIPWLYLAFAASSLQLLFPGSFSHWLLRNRKIIGLCFALTMAWQLFFILWMVTIYSDYYINNVYVLRDAIEGVTGYLFLLAMTATSFDIGRRQVSAKTWSVLHKCSMYFLWAYAFSVYWWALFYYEDPQLIDYVYFWTGFLAWALRAAAWRKQRTARPEAQAAHGSVPPVIRKLGYAVIVVGILAAGFGSAWREPVQALITGYSFTALPENYLPFWPFEPFLPMLLIVFGAWLSIEVSKPVIK